MYLLHWRSTLPTAMPRRYIRKLHSKPQREEFFVDSGYYKFHEIYHLLRFSNEKQIVEKAYQEYLEMRSAGLWARGQKYF